MAMFASLGRDAKLRDDEQGKKLCRIGIALTAVSQGLLLLTDVIEIVKGRKKIEEAE